MFKSSLALVVAVLALASAACGSTSDEEAGGATAAEDKLVEGEEITGRVRTDVQGGNPQLTGVVSWDMIAVKQNGREYYVFGGYDGYGKAAANTRMEVVIEKGDGAYRFTMRAPDGGPLTLTDEQRKSVVADVADILEGAPESALAIITDPKMARCRQGKISIPVKALLITVEVVSKIACAATVLVAPVGIPVCLGHLAFAEHHHDLEMKADRACQ